MVFLLKTTFPGFLLNQGSRFILDRVHAIAKIKINNVKVKIR